MLATWSSAAIFMADKIFGVCFGASTSKLVANAGACYGPSS